MGKTTKLFRSLFEMLNQPVWPKELQGHIKIWQLSCNKHARGYHMTSGDKTFFNLNNCATKSLFNEALQDHQLCRLKISS